MKVTVIPIAVGVLGTVLKGSEKRLDEKEKRRTIKVIQTIASLRLASILRKVLENCHSE